MALSLIAEAQDNTCAERRKDYLLETAKNLAEHGILLLDRHLRQQVKSTRSAVQVDPGRDQPTARSYKKRQQEDGRGHQHNSGTRSNTDIVGEIEARNA